MSRAHTGRQEPDEARRRLGLAVGARAEEVLERQDGRLGRESDPLYSSDYEEDRRLRSFFGTLFIARWLATGERASRDELAWMVRGGRLAVAEGVPFSRTVRGYQAWRDAVIEVIEEEASRLGTPPAIVAEAVAMTRASCDATLARMAGQQDVHRIEMLQRLAESEERFRSLFQTVSCGVIVFDRDGNVLELNDAVASLLGAGSARRLRSANLLTSTVQVIDETGVDLRALFKTVIDSAVPLRGRILELPAVEERSTMWVHSDLLPILDHQGRVVQVVAMFVDVTAVQKAERVRAENEAKNRFLAKMSHELRTPLNSVLGFAQLLRLRVGARLNEKELRYLDNIEVSGMHLLAVIDDILDLTNASTGRLDLVVEDVDLRPLIEAVGEELGAVARAKGLDLGVVAEGEVVVRADPARIRQVLVHLASNAIRFTRSGSVRICAAREGSEVELRVVDTGIGIPAEHLDQVFIEFSQVERGLTRSHDGSGVGLSLARNLVELMGGELAIESAVGQGTTVRVLLPAVTPTSTAAVTM